MPRTTTKVQAPESEAGKARLSPVRRAHAQIAQRHGRAGAPGVLGIPLEAVEDGEAPDDDGRAGNGNGHNGNGHNGNGRGANGNGGARGSGKKGSSAKSSGGAGETVTAKKPKPAREATSAKGNGNGSKAASSDDDDRSGTRGESGSGADREEDSGRGRQDDGESDGRDEAEGTAQRAGGAVAEAAGNAVRAIGDKVSAPDLLPSGGLKGKLVRHAARKMAGKAISTGAKAATAAITRTGERVAESVRGRTGAPTAESVLAHARRLPIQRSVDVAVPIELAWDQWMQFDYFPEGAHRVADVQREDGRLVGQVDAISSPKWEAEVIEERPCESFAWQSVEGGDCAGLITFHQLSERLTRIELNLDCRPVGVGEALALASHLADRRAEADLRRFKAHVELINPDVYKDILDGGSKRKRASGGAKGGRGSRSRKKDG